MEYFQYNTIQFTIYFYFIASILNPNQGLCHIHLIHYIFLENVVFFIDHQRELSSRKLPGRSKALVWFFFSKKFCSFSFFVCNLVSSIPPPRNVWYKCNWIVSIDCQLFYLAGKILISSSSFFLLNFSRGGS